MAVPYPPSSHPTYLIKCGFMNSVLTEPSMSLTPYSTRHSSPALKIMHTWDGRRLPAEPRTGAERCRQCVRGCSSPSLQHTHTFILKVELLVPSRAVPGHLQAADQTSLADTPGGPTPSKAPSSSPTPLRSPSQQLHPIGPLTSLSLKVARSPRRSVSEVRATRNRSRPMICTRSIS